MVMGRPHFYYSDIGNKARDLLYKDYLDQRYSYRRRLYFDWSVGFHCHLDNLVPGLNMVVSCCMLNPTNGKAVLQYSNDFFGINTGIGSIPSPNLNLSGVTGSGTVCLGTEVAFDTTARSFTKCNVGLSFSRSNLTTSLTMNGMGRVLNASCYYTLVPATHTALGAELSHSLLSNEATITIGSRRVLNSYTLVKARVNTDGKASGLVKLNWQSILYLILAGEVGVRRTATFGFTVGLKP